MIPCVLTLNKPSTEKCILFRKSRDELRMTRMTMNGNKFCAFSRKYCQQRNAQFFRNYKKMICGCRCLEGFDTYKRDMNSCVDIKKTREGKFRNENLSNFYFF